MGSRRRVNHPGRDDAPQAERTHFANMITRTAYTPERYMNIGARFSSDKINLQGQETAAMWNENLAVFTDFGQGATELDKFQKLLERHAAAIAARPRKLTERTVLVAERDETVHAGWIWNKKAIGALAPLAREDSAVAVAVNNARAVDDVDLLPSNEMLCELLAAHRDRLAPEVPVQARLDEHAALRPRLMAVFGAAEVAKGRPVLDTEEIDELDGRLYVIMRDFNELGRAAVRAGLIVDRPPYFRFNHLGAGFRKPAAPAPEPPPEA